MFLTVRTTAMVCWLFVGSWTFSSVFSYLGGEQVVREFVVGLDMTPLQFLLLAQLIIFLLGWPLEWSEIIIIFVPIFLPLLPLFDIDPLFFGILIALNLQTSFLTPPMAMSAYYLKGIAPPHVRLTQIFAGSLPYVAMVFVTMIILYVFPDGVAYWSAGRMFYGRWRNPEMIVAVDRDAFRRSPPSSCSPSFRHRRPDGQAGRPVSPPAPVAGPRCRLRLSGRQLFRGQAGF